MANVVTQATANERSLRSVFVGNIPYDASEEKLKDIFSEVGPVLSFKLVYDRESGKPKGYGFCEYRDQETAASAMRNLNGYELNSRNLRVDTATNERFKEEMKNLQMSLSGNSFESPYGTDVDPEKTPEAIAKVVASLPPEQMFELARQMKHCVLTNPNEARNMLLQNPQLAYALLQALVVMRAVDPAVASSILYKPNPPPIQLQPGNVGPVPGSVQQQPHHLVPNNPQPGPGQGPPPPPQMTHQNLYESHDINPFIRPPPQSGSQVVPSGPGPGQQQIQQPPANHNFDQQRHIDPRLRQGPPQQQQQQPDNVLVRPMSNDVGQFHDQRMTAPPPLPGSGSGPPPSAQHDPRVRSTNQTIIDPRLMPQQQPSQPTSNVPPIRGPSVPGSQGLPSSQQGGGPPMSRFPASFGPGSGPQQQQQPTTVAAPSSVVPTVSGGGVVPPIVSSTSAVSSGTSSSTSSSTPATAGQPATAQGQTQSEQEKAQLIMQVLALSDQQIAMLPAEQRQSIMMLKEQLSRGGPQ